MNFPIHHLKSYKEAETIQYFHHALSPKIENSVTSLKATSAIQLCKFHNPASIEVELSLSFTDGLGSSQSDVYNRR